MSSSCDPCKQRHLKCDRIRPICGKCQKSRAKLTCRYRDTRFRQSLLSILANPAPSSDGSPAVEQASEPSESPVNEDTSYLDSHAFSGNQTEQRGPSVLSTPHHVVSPLEASAHPRWQPNLSSPDVSSSGPLIGQDSPEQHSSVTSSSKPVRITETESEFFLYYLKHAGIWLDIVSPNRSFSQEVPRRALRNPLLYYSCLAYAAHVLCLQGHSDDASAHHYLNKAISYLIPLLNPGSMSVAAQDGLLAAIAILRMSEQFLEPDEDAQTHIHGAFSLLTNSTIKWLPDRVDMSGAAFWVFVRQSLRICFLSEQPCQFDLDIIGSDNLFAPAADEVWTNRMTFLLAKASNACWSMSLHESQFWKEELDSLEADINCWFQSLPETFKPWFYQDTPSQPFPKIYCLTSWHAIALQQYYTSKTLIAVYRKKQEALKTYYETGRYWNSKILVPARLTCALVLSDTDVGSGVNGAHLAYWCGQFLMGRTEQYELLKWLEIFMKKTKWPNRTCIDRLHKQWVLVPDDSFDRDLPPPV